MLLRAGADANTYSKCGTTPLMAGVMGHNDSSVKALLQCADMLDLDRCFPTNNSISLGVAAYMGTPKLCEILMKSGASRTHVNDHGATKLHDACQNVATTELMLDLLWNDGELDINVVVRPRTMFWHLVDGYFRMGVKRSFMVKSQFVMEMAHTEENTPLHYSAMSGLIHVTE